MSDHPQLPKPNGSSAPDAPTLLAIFLAAFAASNFAAIRAILAEHCIYTMIDSGGACGHTWKGRARIVANLRRIRKAMPPQIDLRWGLNSDLPHPAQLTWSLTAKRATYTNSGTIEGVVANLTLISVREVLDLTNLGKLLRDTTGSPHTVRLKRSGRDA